MARDDGDPESPRFGGSLPVAAPDETDRAVAEPLTVLGRKHSLALLTRFAADTGALAVRRPAGRAGGLPGHAVDAALGVRGTRPRRTGVLPREPPAGRVPATAAAEGLRPVFKRLYDWQERRDRDGP